MLEHSCECSVWRSHTIFRPFQTPCPYQYKGLNPIKPGCCVPLKVVGRRRVLLFAPTQAFNGMYPFPVAHPYDRYAMPDLERPDATAWPALTGARGCVALLHPGDVLFVPAFWCAPAQDPHYV